MNTVVDQDSLFRDKQDRAKQIYTDRGLQAKQAILNVLYNHI